MLYVSIRSRALDLSFVPPSFDPLPNDPAVPAFLPACDDQLQQDLSDGAGWFLPHVRIINVDSLNHILPPESGCDIVSAS